MPTFIARRYALGMIARGERLAARVRKEGKKDSDRTAALRTGRNALHKDVDATNAEVFSLRIWRRDRKCWDRQYYVLGLSCRKHYAHVTMACIPRRSLGRVNPCWLCRSEGDLQGIICIEQGVKGDTVRSLRRRTGMTVEQAAKHCEFRKQLHDDSPLRKSAKRRESHAGKNVPLLERITSRLRRYSKSDPRRAKLLSLKSRLDLGHGVIVNKRVNGKATLFVRDISCKVHKSCRVPQRQLGRFLEGANPCPECQREMRSSASAGKRRWRWTTERLRRELRSNKPLRNRHKAFDLGGVAIRLLRKGGRNVAHVCGIRCLTHGQEVRPILVNHFLARNLFCPQCPAASAYREDEARLLLESVHGNSVSILRYGGGVLEESEFQCGREESHVWKTALNNLLGQSERKPTGCPFCAQIAATTESGISGILGECGLRRATRDGESLDEAVAMLMQTPQSFCHNIRVLRKGKRELRVDYLVRAMGEIFALEVDGPQHYGLRYRDYTEKQFLNVQALDAEKVRLLARSHSLPTYRLPLPLLKTVDLLRQEVKMVLAGRGRWRGAPQREWLTVVLGR